jgi:hypothetical protein
LAEETRSTPTSLIHLSSTGLVASLKEIKEIDKKRRGSIPGSEVPGEDSVIFKYFIQITLK